MSETKSCPTCGSGNKKQRNDVWGSTGDDGIYCCSDPWHTEPEATAQPSSSGESPELDKILGDFRGQIVGYLLKQVRLRTASPTGGTEGEEDGRHQDTAEVENRVVSPAITDSGIRDGIHDGSGVCSQKPSLTPAAGMSAESAQLDVITWYYLRYPNFRGFYPSQTDIEEFSKDCCAPLLEDIARINAWKELQEIGRLLDLPLGSSIHDKIASGIRTLQAEVERLRKELEK